MYIKLKIIKLSSLSYKVTKGICLLKWQKAFVLILKNRIEVCSIIISLYRINIYKDKDKDDKNQNK